MICPHCQTENRPGAKFCNECGCKLVEAQELEAEDVVCAPADEAAEPNEPVELTGPAKLAEPVEPTGETAAAADLDDGAAEAVVATVADEAAEAVAASADGVVDELPEPLARTGTMPRINIVADKTQVLAPVAQAAPAAESPVDTVGKTQVLTPVSPNESADGASAAEEADASGEEVIGQEDAAEIASESAPADKAADGSSEDSAEPSEPADADAPFSEEAAGASKDAPANRDARPQADLSGFDEYLVNPGYMPARSAWHAGDTMQMPALKDVEIPKQKEFKAPTDPHKPSRKSKGKGKAGKIVVAVIAVLVVAAAVAAGVTYQMEMWGGKIIPNVVGMTQADATFVLENKGFSVRTTSVASDDTEGMVLLMDPGADARQEEGSEVVIHVSTSRLVPDVVGKSQEEAVRLFADNGFENVTYVQESSDEDAGTVLSVSPEAGEKAKAKSAITVTVAQPYTVPDVTGMTPSQAAAAIEEAGLTSSTVTVYSETIPEGYMIGIDPASGSEVSSSTVVTISVAKSRGTELVAAARSYLASGSLKASDGSTFTISSVNSCTYQGNDEVAFTATGVASTSVTVLGQTLSVSGDSKQVSGTIGFDAYNNVTSLSFS